MSLPTISCSRTVICWVALIAAATLITPAFAQPVATPSALAFDCTYTQANPCVTFVPRAVTFTDSGNAVTITSFAISLQPTGPSGATANAFLVSKSGTQLNQLNVSIDGGAISSPYNNLVKAGGSYQGNLHVVIGNTAVDVPLSLNINASQSSSVTVQPSSVAMQTTVGGTQSAIVNLGGTNGVSYSATATTANGINWLLITQSTGVTPGTITVTAYAGALTNGTYTGTININAGGTPLSVPVTLTVGTGSSGLTANPSTVNLSTPNNTTTTNATVIIQNVSFATSYSAYIQNQTGGLNWLSFGSGQIFTSGTISSGYASIFLYANPAGLSTGQYYATLTVTSFPDNASISVPVYLNVGTSGGNTGLLTINPNSIAFTAPTLNVSPGSQYFTVTAPTSNTFYTLTATSANNWLTVNGLTSITGTLNPSATFYVTANTLGLPAGTYSGTIAITTSGGTTTSATIPVSLLVGFGGGTGTGATIAPASLTFSGQSNGINKPGPQYIAVGGTGGLYTVAATTTSGNWLSIDSTTGNSPYWITVTVNPTGLAAGSYSGNVAITQSGVTTNVPVTLSLTSGAAVIANPSGIFTNAYGGSIPTQTLYITMSDNSASQTYTATPSASWIAVTPASGTLTGSTTLLVTLNSSLLAGGLNTGTIALTVNGAANSPLTIPVTVNNPSGTGGGGGTGTGYLSFSQSALSFTDTASAAQTILVSSSQGSIVYTASATTTTGVNWLFVSPSTGITPSNVTISVSTAGLAQGTYSGNVNFTANGLTQSIPVTLTIGAGIASTITANPAQLTFTAQGSTPPAAQTINLTGTTGVVSWSGSVKTTDGGSWLSLSTGAGAIPGKVDVNINPANLAAGDYTGTITFAPNTGNVTTVTVKLTVKPNPTVTASPVSLTYSYRAGDAVPATQQINVTAKDSTTPLSWTASVDSGSSWLSISPASGSTPGTINVNITPGSLDQGTYTGTIKVAGAGGASGSTTTTVTLTVTAPLPSISRVVNGASYTSGALAPGEIIVISGTAIGPNDLAQGSLDNSTGRWQTTVGGVQVLINGITAPVLYATNSQIGAIVPYEVAGRLDAFVQVRFRGLTSNAITQIPVTTTVPGLFTSNAAGTGQGAILNSDSSLNGPGNPAAKGSVVVLYATGEGLSQNASGGRPATGQVVNVAGINDLPRPLLPVAVLIDGQPCTVTYAGQAPGQIAGLFQVNAIVPPGVSSGNVSVVVSVGSNSSQSGVTVSVR